MKSHVFYYTAVTSAPSLYSEWEKSYKVLILARFLVSAYCIDCKSRTWRKVSLFSWGTLRTFFFQHLWSWKVKHMVLKPNFFLSTWAVVHKMKLTALVICRKLFIFTCIHAMDVHVHVSQNYQFKELLLKRSHILLPAREMFTPNFSAAMNRLLNRSLCFIPASLLEPDTRPAKCLPTCLRRNLKLRWHWAYGTYLEPLFEKATCVSQCRVAKSASCWPADGPNSDIIIMNPSNLTALHVGFMCDGIKTLFLRIRFSLRPFPPQKDIRGCMRVERKSI